MYTLLHGYSLVKEKFVSKEISSIELIFHFRILIKPHLSRNEIR